MMISDETLMAYADGELDAAAREAVETAMREDAQIAMRVAQHRALRQRIQAAYASELSDAIPDRLLRAAKNEGTKNKVVNLHEAAMAMKHRAAHARTQPLQWQTIGTIAASLILGLGVGFFMWGHTDSPLMTGTDGALIAQGRLSETLSNQLVAEQSRNSTIQIGISFLAKSGDYCRTFALAGTVSSSGLACRHGQEWQVQALTQQTSDNYAAAPEYRTAGSPISTAILQLSERQIIGEPLDQAGERLARQQSWNKKNH